MDQIYERAITESKYVKMYAEELCQKLHTSTLEKLLTAGGKPLFRMLLCTRCQQEFQKMMLEPTESDQVDEEQARKRAIGNIRFVGALYKARLIQGKIVNWCLTNLIKGDPPRESYIEAFCVMLTECGEAMEFHGIESTKETIKQVMTSISRILEEYKTTLNTRVRFGIKDLIDLRRNRWRQRDLQVKEEATTLDAVLTAHEQDQPPG